MEAFLHNFVCSFKEVDTGGVHIPKTRSYQGYIGKICTFRVFSRAEVLALQRVPFHESKGDEVVDFSFKDLSVKEMIPIVASVCSPMELGRGVWILVTARHPKNHGETYVRPCRITYKDGKYHVSCSAVSAGYPQGSIFVFGLEKKVTV